MASLKGLSGCDLQPSLAVCFLFAVRSLPVPLALFDSRLDQLKLPVIKPPTSFSFNATSNDDEDQSGPRLESVLAFVEKYFEYAGVFEQGMLSQHSFVVNQYELITQGGMVMMIPWREDMPAIIVFDCPELCRANKSTTVGNG